MDRENLLERVNKLIVNADWVSVEKVLLLGLLGQLAASYRDESVMITRQLDPILEKTANYVELTDGEKSTLVEICAAIGIGGVTPEDFAEAGYGEAARKIYGSKDSIALLRTFDAQPGATTWHVAMLRWITANVTVGAASAGALPWIFSVVYALKTWGNLVRANTASKAKLERLFARINAADNRSGVSTITFDYLKADLGESRFFRLVQIPALISDEDGDLRLIPDLKYLPIAPLISWGLSVSSTNSVDGFFDQYAGDLDPEDPSLLGRLDESLAGLAVGRSEAVNFACGATVVTAFSTAFWRMIPGSKRKTAVDAVRPPMLPTASTQPTETTSLTGGVDTAPVPRKRKAFFARVTKAISYRVQSARTGAQLPKSFLEKSIRRAVAVAKERSAALTTDAGVDAEMTVSKNPMGGSDPQNQV
jgi:hypothetical protein